MINKELEVQGIKCDACVLRINNVLSKIKGVLKYEVLKEQNKILLDIKNDKVLAKVIASIKDLGFEVLE